MNTLTITVLMEATPNLLSLNFYTYAFSHEHRPVRSDPDHYLLFFPTKVIVSQKCTDVNRYSMIDFGGVFSIYTSGGVSSTASSFTLADVREVSVPYTSML